MDPNHLPEPSEPRKSEAKRDKPPVRAVGDTTTIAAIVLIVVGAVFFAVSNGLFGNLEWGRIWPVFPGLAGVALLAFGALQPNREARTWLVFAGTIPLLIGAFFFLAMNGALGDDAPGRLWPVFPFIVGLAFFAAYFASGRRRRLLLFPGIVLASIATIFIALLWTGQSFSYVGRLWPLALIVAGVGVLVTGYMAKRSRRE